MEHHSNLIPWQLVAQKTGARLKFVQLTPEEEFDFGHYQSLVNDKTKLVSVVHVSNTLGCINPVKDIIALAHQYGAKVLIDACQSAPHMPLDVQDMDCDWLAVSGHKMCGPTGIGFLYGKLNLMQSFRHHLRMVASIASSLTYHTGSQFLSGRTFYVPIPPSNHNPYPGHLMACVAHFDKHQLILLRHIDGLVR